MQVVTGIPDSSTPTVLATLTHPTTLGTGNLEFTAPAGTKLIANTRVLGDRELEPGHIRHYDIQTSRIREASPGWSVANDRYSQNIASPGSWGRSDQSLKIRVNGTVSAVPTLVRARVPASDRTKLRLLFDRDLEAATLSNTNFAVKRTPQGGMEADAPLGSTAPAISGRTVTLTLASAVLATDAVTVSYTKPTTGTGNRIRSTGGEADSFSDQAASHNRAPVYTAVVHRQAMGSPASTQLSTRLRAQLSRRGSAGRPSATPTATC